MRRRFHAVWAVLPGFVVLTIACSEEVRLPFELVGESPTPTSTSTPHVLAIDATAVGHVEAVEVSSLDMTFLSVGAGEDECLIASLALDSKNAGAITLTWT